MYIFWLVLICLVVYGIGRGLAGREQEPAQLSAEPMTFVPNELGVYVEQQPRASRPFTIRARVIIAFGLMALFCVVMAYATGKPDVIGGCTWGLGATGCTYADHSSPNIVWFFFGFWPGVVAVFTAFGSWILTGRPW